MDKKILLRSDDERRTYQGVPVNFSSRARRHNLLDILRGLSGGGEHKNIFSHENVHLCPNFALPVPENLNCCPASSQGRELCSSILASSRAP